MSTKTKWNARSLTRVALFAAVLAVFSQVAIPLPSGVPVTLQTFAVALIGYTLGVREGALAVLVYLLLGAVGVPVFAGLKGGAMLFAGLTGGFLWGFVPAAAVAGIGKGRALPVALACGVLGLLLLHALGLGQFVLVSGMPVAKALFTVSVPFLPKDILSVVVALFLARIIERRLHW